MKPERCPQCSAPLELPVSLIRSGPRRAGIEDISYCTSCGESLTETLPTFLSTAGIIGVPWEKVALVDARATTSTFHAGKLGIMSELKDRPMHRLGVLELIASMSFFAEDD
jgi:hypothetical protein